MSRWKLRRLLENNGVKIIKLGKRNKGVLLSALKTCFPEFWDSIEEKKHLESLSA